MTSTTAAPRRTAPVAATGVFRSRGAGWRDPVCVALATAALIAGAVGAINPTIYQADLTLQVRAPADSDAAATSLDAEAREAAVELGAASLVARTDADVMRAASGRTPPRGAFDGLLSVGSGGTALPTPLGVEIRLVGGTGRLHLTRRSFSAVQAPLVLNTLADEFVRIRAARVAAQEQRFAAALAEVEDQLLANAAAADRVMGGGGAGDPDLLAAATPPAYSRLLADQYARMSPVAEPVPAASGPAPAALERDGRREILERLRLRRADLAARYLADAAPIREIDAVIAAFEDDVPPVTSATAETVGPQASHKAGDGGQAGVKAGLAALARTWSAARSLAPRLEPLARQAGALRADAQILSADLARVRLRRLAGPSAGADVDVVERALVPAAGVSLRPPLEILAFGLLGLSLALRRRAGRGAGEGLPSTGQGAAS